MQVVFGFPDLYQSNLHLWEMAEYLQPNLVQGTRGREGDESDEGRKGGWKEKRREARREGRKEKGSRKKNKPCRLLCPGPLIGFHIPSLPWTP